MQIHSHDDKYEYSNRTIGSKCNLNKTTMDKEFQEPHKI